MRGEAERRGVVDGVEHDGLRFTRFARAKLAQAVRDTSHEFVQLWLGLHRHQIRVLHAQTSTVDECKRTEELPTNAARDEHRNECRWASIRGFVERGAHPAGTERCCRR